MLDMATVGIRLRGMVIALSVLGCALVPPSRAEDKLGDQPTWIWSAAYEKEQAPAGACYFRKTFTAHKPDAGNVQIACDDNYVLYVNGRKVGSGDNWRSFDLYDISSYLVDGKNVVAVRAENLQPGSAGLVARVTVSQSGIDEATYATDASWRTTLKEAAGWQQARYSDAQWVPARSFGDLGATLPWGNEVTAAGRARFKTLREFHVEWVVDPKETGPLIAMAFDEFGQILAGRETGPLLLVHDENQDGLVESVSTYCDQVTNCQGILSLSGRVYVIAQGPEGSGLYRLTDKDQDRKVDQVEQLIKFAGEMSEHGPHGLVFGPDGLIYIVMGNFSKLERPLHPTSPYHHYYEGDLLKPRYEDAGGHAAGIKAPGGAILRTDSNGTAVELFAGGLQNPYDLAFNRDGELFTCDSDMEWDVGMTWYRPTRVVHVVPGGEYGWRSGWAKWPAYYMDNLPPVTELGRGSPAGLEIYNHFMYPARFHNALFVCDWSRGRILAVQASGTGGTYKANTEVFLEGQPLNVTDAAVAPDGWLYFCTGGRGTEGGIYRVVWEGTVPPKVRDPGRGFVAALRQPQISSAWARQKLALLKHAMGNQWGRDLRAVAQNPKRTVPERVRAVDLLHLFGPHPDEQLLLMLSKEQAPALRAKAVTLLGLYGSQSGTRRIAELVNDPEPLVQRAACEAVVRSRALVPPADLVELLGSSDRFVAWSAARALQQLQVAQWQPAIMESENKQVFLRGAAALLALDARGASAQVIVDRCRELMQGYLTDDEFVDVLRLTELALTKDSLPGDHLSELRKQLSKEYPAQDAHMNRELVRLLAHLQEPTAAERFVQQAKGKGDRVEQLHAAIHSRFLQQGWTTSLKLELVDYFEKARELPGGHSYTGYIDNIARDFVAGFNDVERKLVLAEGQKWPTCALAALATLPKKFSPELLTMVRDLDRKLDGVEGEPARRLRVATVAVLGMSGDEESQVYLRRLYERAPDRRVTIAMGLAQHPGGENWPLLVRSLPIVEGAVAQEVMMRLAQVPQKPTEPEPYRQVIIRGLMLGDAGGRHAVALLEKWGGRRLSEPQQPLAEALAAWQEWFTDIYPDEPAPKLPTETAKSQWTYQELVSYLGAARGDAQRGVTVFEKAQCAKCHQFGTRGHGFGPDLTTVGQRFQKKEILESIFYPSQVISDQYAAHTVLLTSGRTLTGILVQQNDGTFELLESAGERMHLERDEIEEMKRSKQSAMPEGLLNNLSLQEIADLFAFMTGTPAAEVANSGSDPQ